MFLFPGSGKSYLAKVLRDVEVMNGGSAPRIHSMDDYFTCEVEKVRSWSFFAYQHSLKLLCHFHLTIFFCIVHCDRRRKK